MLPFLLVPGLNCTGRVFQHAAEALWPLGPVMIANHVEGEGMAGIAARILEAAPARFALAGFSMGGYIALEIWRQAPERVGGIAFIDTMARPDNDEETRRRTDAIRLTEAGRFTQLVAANFANVVHPDNAGKPDLDRIRMEMALSLGPQTYVRHQRGIMGRRDFRPDLHKIAVPVNVIVGEADTVTTPEDARVIAGQIPGAELTVIAGAGHFAPVEQPDAVAAALRHWAGRQDSRRNVK